MTQEASISPQRYFSTNHSPLSYSKTDPETTKLRYLIHTESEDLVLHTAQDFLSKAMLKAFCSKDPDSIKKELESFGCTSLFHCGKLIGDYEHYYQCLDCDKFKTNEIGFQTVICKDCFENSDHKDHRILLLTHNEAAGPATCDCGNEDYLDLAGFCKSHSNLHQNLEEILLKVPTELKNAFNSIFRNIFYTVFSCFEEAEYLTQIFPHGEESRKTVDVFTKVSLVILDCIRVFSKCIKISKVFIFMVSSLFRSQLPSDNCILLHDCKDLSPSRDSTNKKPHQCQCTILELILRFMKFLPRQAQTDLTKLFTELLVDQDFRLQIAKSIGAYIGFLYVPLLENIEEIKGEDMLFCDVLRLSGQIYNNQDQCLALIDENEFIVENIYNSMINIIKEHDYPSKEIRIQLWEIGKILSYCFFRHTKEAGLALINETGYFERIFDMLSLCVTKFFYSSTIKIGTRLPDIDYELMGDTLAIAKTVQEFIEEGCKVFSYIEDTNTQREVAVKFSKELVQCLSSCRGST